MESLNRFDLDQSPLSKSSLKQGTLTKARHQQISRKRARKQLQKISKEFKRLVSKPMNTQRKPLNSPCHITSLPKEFPPTAENSEHKSLSKKGTKKKQKTQLLKGKTRPSQQWRRTLGVFFLNKSPPNLGFA